MFRRGAAVGSCFALLAASALAQTPAGNEFRVNVATLFYQLSPAVAMKPDGSFVVAFTAPDPDPSNYGVWAKHYDARGAAQSPEFVLNSYTTDYQGQASVATRPHGDFVVVWSSYYQDGSLNSVVGRRFDALGNGQGTEFVVNTYTTGYQEFPTVAGLKNGGFVVTWRSQRGVPSYMKALARVYGPGGQPIGDEFDVNSRFQVEQYGVATASDGDDRFVIVYSHFRGADGDANGLFAQRYDASGKRVGGEFQVNSYTTASQGGSSVAMTPDGRFVVVWLSQFQDGDDLGVFGRRYDAAGQPAGPEFAVNTYTTGRQNYASVVSDQEGNFIVSWTSMGQDGGVEGVFARRFDAAGSPRGPEFRVNSYTTERQMDMKVGVDPSGNFVALWASLRQDGDGDGVYGQRYGGLVPADVVVDPVAGGASDGNGVFEAGESVGVQPAWRNVSGQAQAFSGTASGLTGPAGPTYTLLDGNAGYGTVADGATGGCAASANCYAARVAGTRPALHWDATVRERISPDSQGQTKTWSLHLGESFTDVARGSIFYRFVETLLHHGITSGCGSTLYCPASPATREQMAVFVLSAKEGQGYTPPPCTTQVFADVPVSSPFCPWIQELARRGIVGGCGGANFCPAGAVTREQMAVFVLGTKEGPVAPAPCFTSPFADVPVSSPFCPWIQELARRGVVSGCGGGNYCPAAPVTREQMSVFLSGTFVLALYGP